MTVTMRKCSKNRWVIGILFLAGSFYFYSLHSATSHKRESKYDGNSRKAENHIQVERGSGVLQVPAALAQLSNHHGDTRRTSDLISMKSAANTKMLQKLSWYCQSEMELGALPAPSRMYNIPAYNLSLTLIAKVASTSWVAFLAKTVVPECMQHIDHPSLGYATLHECVKAELDTHSHLPRYNVRAVFVRDPWKRLVSVYEDKIVKQRFVQASSCYLRWNITRIIPDTEGNGDSLPNLSFHQFLTCIAETRQNPNILDPHYRPQYLMHGPCQASYTHIGRLEDIDNDFIHIITAAQPNLSHQNLQEYRTQFRQGPRRPWEMTNLKEKQAKYEDYYKGVNNDLMSTLQDIYKWDVLLYGYKLHPLDTSN